MSLKLVSQNSGFSILNKSSDTAELSIYGIIGQSWFEEGVTAKAIDAELKKLPDTVKNLTIRLNSVGGDVFEGLTIYNRLKQFKATKKVIVEGLAASIASIIMLAGDEITIGTGALVMIHLPSTGVRGDRRAFEETLDTLMVVEEQLITVYAKYMKGKSRKEIQKMMEDETWLSAEEAIKEGLAHKQLENALPIAACLLDKASLWMKKAPTNIYTDQVAARNRAKEVSSKIEGFLKITK